MSNFKFSIFKPEFVKKQILLLFTLLSCMMLNAQVSAKITPGSNPPTVVRMGDPVDFPVTVFNTSSTITITGAVFSIKAPVGWRIISAVPALTFINPAKDSASINITPITPGSSLLVTVKMLPLCEALSETGMVQYQLISGSDRISETTPLIGNFKDVTLLTNAPSMQVELNKNTTRTFAIEQTALDAYVNALKVEITNVKQNAVVISKLEISKDSLIWMDISPASLAMGVDKYVYTITNEQLTTAFAGKLNKGDKLYMRETVMLKECGYGDATYNFFYGDGTTWCNTNSPKTVSLSVYVPSYKPNITTFKTGTVAKSSAENGILYFKIENNATQIEAVMHDILVPTYNSDYSRFIYKKAYFVDATGNKITTLPEIPIQDSRRIYNVNIVTNDTTTVVKSDARVYVVSFDKLPTDPQYTAGYASAGLSSVDGDGIFNDIEVGKSVYIAVEWNFELSMTSCSTQLYTGVTRRADLLHKNSCGIYSSYTQNYAINGMNVGTTNSHMGYGYITDKSVTVVPVNLSIGTNAVITINTSNTFGIILDPNYHWKEITLPEGFRYNSAVGISGVSPADITYVSDILSDIVTFKVPNNAGTNSNYRIGVTYTAATLVSSKNVGIKNKYDWDGGFKEFNCVSLPLNYEQIIACGYLNMTNFAAERTTFGYTTPASGVKADRNTPGINLKAASPYDNVDFIADMEVNGNITLSAGQKFLAKLTYEGRVAGATLYYFDKAIRGVNGGATITGTINGIADTINVPESAITYGYGVNAENKPMHTLTLDLTSYLKTLKAADNFKITLKTQTREVLSIAPISIPTMYMNVYIEDISGVVPDCNKLADNFLVVDYKRATWGTGNTFTVNQNSPNAGTTIGMQWISAESVPFEVYTDEFRPNQTHKNISIEIDGLVRLKDVSIRTYGQAANVGTINLAEETDYTLSYKNCKTTINISREFSPGEHSNGTYYQIRAIPEFMVQNGYNSRIVNDVIYYPTSETSKEIINSTQTYNFEMRITPYVYDFTAVQPSINPVSNRGEWILKVTNQSTWAATDGVLPNSWIAVEVPAGGVTPLELWDGNTKLTGSFTSYGTNKWWFKMDDINVTSFKDYKLVCSYTECTNKVTVNAKFGSSRMDYPDNPEVGYQSKYNSGMCITPKNVELSLTPPVSDFSTRILATAKGNGKYDFCTDIPFTTEYANGLDSKLHNMEIKVKLPIGMTFESLATTTVKVGNGAAVSVPAVNINVNGQTVTIKLPESIAADSYKTGDANPDAHVYVMFNLKPGCGFASGSGVYFEMVAESGCSKRTTKLGNSPQIHIDGLSTAPPVMTITKSGNPTVSYKSPAAGQGEVSITGSYKLLSAGTNNMYAIIDVPDNMTIGSQLGNIMFTKSGTRLTAKLPDNAPSNSVYDFTMVLKAVNTELWECKEYDILMQYGIIASLNCNGPCDIFLLGDNNEKVTFTIEKNIAGIKPTVTAVSKYKNNTTESVTFKGSVFNNNNTGATDIKVEVYLDNDNSGTLSAGDTPASGNPSFSFNAIPAGTMDLQFTQSLDIVSTDICKLILVVRRSGIPNAYLCDSSWAKPAVPVYEIATPPDTVCINQNITVGDDQIGGYTYQWSGSNCTFISGTTSSKATVKYGASSEGNQTLTLQITRGSCISSSTIPVNVSNCIIAKDDEMYVFDCGSAEKDVLTNDDLNSYVIIPNIVSGPSLSGASLNITSGNKITYTNLCGNAGKQDNFKYALCPSGGICDTASVKVYVMRRPIISLVDSCSSAPKMVLDIQYPGVYLWQYSTTNAPNSWIDLNQYTEAECKEIKEGYYRVKILYKDAEIYTLEKNLIEIQKNKLPSGAWWYQMSLQ